MKKKKIVHIVGARPNFMKIAPLLRAAKKYKNFKPLLVHTGQHYDENLSDVFFRDLGLGSPDHFLGASKNPSEQFADIFNKFCAYLNNEKPDLVVVVGDVTSTVACALAAKYCGIKVAHVEAGLRSFDRDMPEERNRVLTDSVCDYLFVTEHSGIKNLIKEGIPKSKIHFVGNTMIDSLAHGLENIRKSQVVEKLGLTGNKFAVVTLHRPSNVDSEKKLKKNLAIIGSISKKIKLVFPVHPRTAVAIEKFDLKKELEKMTNIMTIAPLGYIDFIGLIDKSAFVLTDSGGIQEEASFLGVPCLTMRENTERPITIKEGTNKLVGSDKEVILNAVDLILKKKIRKETKILYWDGAASERIYKTLSNPYV